MRNLYNGDCLQIMDKLIVKGVKVDAIITDPPYGTTACKWDSVIPFNQMWPRLRSLRKERTPIVLFGSEPFSSALRMSNIKEYKYDWIWDKKRGTNFLTAKYSPLKQHEIISVFSKGKSIYIPQMVKGKYRNKKNYIKKTGVYGDVKQSQDHYNDLYYPKTILEISNASQKGKQHPTQKPIALMEYLIKTYTNEGDTVLDFTMGSGTTGVACKNLNRDFIGIELDDKYFKIAEERMNNA